MCVGGGGEGGVLSVEGSLVVGRREWGGSLRDSATRKVRREITVCKSRSLFSSSVKLQ